MKKSHCGYWIEIRCLGLLGVLLGLACAPPQVEPPPANAPRLILLIVVDQMRGDYLERFAPLFDGGLRRFLDTGLSYSEAHHRHAITYTAPGHATISTGCHPSRHGIISNYWFDRESGEEIYSVEEEDPRRLACSSLGDWLKDRYPAARVFAAGGKDRSSILLAGHRADAAFWYDWEGGFKTSEYYEYENRSWLESFNAARPMDAVFGTAWEPEPIPEEVLRALGVVPVDLGPLRPGFPHVFGGASPVPGESFYESLFTSPWLDRHTGALALRLIEEEGLGADRVPDLLALVFSALDSVGHRYGPDSLELVDTLVSLDRTLEEFLRAVDEKVGLENVLLALTSDHGAVTVPEVRSERGLEARRMGNEEILCVQGLERKLSETFGEARWLRPGPVIDEEVLVASSVDRSSLERAIVAALEECPSVAKVWMRNELLNPEADTGPLASLFSNAYHSERSPDFLIQWDEYFMPSRLSASTHGSAYRYDSWVPMVLVAENLEPGVIATPVGVVDLAPTLAIMTGAPVPAGVDGVDLLLWAESLGGGAVKAAAAGTP